GRKNSRKARNTSQISPMTQSLEVMPRDYNNSSIDFSELKRIPASVRFRLENLLLERIKIFQAQLLGVTLQQLETFPKGSRNTANTSAILALRTPQAQPKKLWLDHSA